jgi:hypothetical protein
MGKKKKNTHTHIYKLINEDQNLKKKYTVNLDWMVKLKIIKLLLKN